MSDNKYLSKLIEKTEPQISLCDFLFWPEISIHSRMERVGDDLVGMGTTTKKFKDGHIEVEHFESGVRCIGYFAEPEKSTVQKIIDWILKLIH